MSLLTESYVKVDESPANGAFDTFPGCLRYYASLHPDREAVVFASTDKSSDAVSWKELYDKSCKVARSLVALGVKRSEFVAINIRNCPEWLYLTFGSMMAGARPVSISFTYEDGSDVVALMEKLKTCSMLAMDPGINGDNWTIVNRLIDAYGRDGSVKCSKMPFLRYLICHKNSVEIPEAKSLLDLISDDVPDTELPEINPGDIMTLFQTSGSTGVPKVVAHTHASIIHLNDNIENDDILYNDRPFTWMGGFPLSLLYGQTRVTLDGFCSQPEDKIAFLIDVVKRQKCTAIVTLPPMLHELIKRKDELGDGWPIKLVFVGGQPVTKGLAECLGTICEKIFCAYGGTEFQLVALNTVDNQDEFVEYSCGPVVSGNEVKIVDENGEIVPVNTRGEIYVRNERLFREYYNDPEKTKAVKTADGWYITDDIGRFTEEGVLFVEGRKSNMILSGGMNVAPEILETVIMSCPGVASVAIVPIPHEIQYQVLCACVIMKPGWDASEEKIRIFCEEKHSDKQGLFTILPTYYLFLGEFPETKTGKMSRKELESMAKIQLVIQ